MKAIDQIKELRKGYAYVEISAYNLANHPDKQYFKENKEKYRECMEYLCAFNFGDFFSVVELETAQLTPQQKQTYKEDLFAALISYDCYMSGKKDAVLYPFTSTLIKIIEDKELLANTTSYQNKDYLQMCWDRVDILEKWVLAGATELAIQSIDSTMKESSDGVKMKIGKLPAQSAERLHKLCVKYKVFKNINPDDFCEGFRCTNPDDQPLKINIKDAFFTLYRNSDNIFATQEQRDSFFSSFGIDTPTLVKRAGQEGDSKRQIDFAKALQALK